MENTRVDFLYLDEEEMIEAGVKDMHQCVGVMEEVFSLLGQGDYIMGGKNHNSHGILISFPDEPQFPNMPKNGPDRRFMAMTAYLGGRFRVAGEKWYGSNKENLSKGLPRSILMVMLNDADTGAPLALMSGNLISAFRTGAIPGVGAKYLAKKDSRVLSLIAAGVISRTCFLSLIDSRPGIETVKIYDIYRESSEKLAAFIKENYPSVKEICVCGSIEEAVKDADIINVAASGKIYPKIEERWLKPGAFLSLPAGIELEEEFLTSGRCRRVVDNWKMYEAWSEELTKPYWNIMGLIGTKYLDLIEDGKLSVSQIDNLGEIIAGKKEGRKDDREIILLGMGGMPVYDVAWGFQMLENARKKGLGTTLHLWDRPDMA
ncbi:ornithine cyclodeaminase [butyrate-producing bacterium SM4/1]|nr:ornithine cyclodeaminase [butyrate-producing bacterium SM4/1]